MKMKYAGMIIVLLLLSGCAMKEAAPIKIYTLNAGKVPVVSTNKYRTKVLKVSFPQTLKEKITEKMRFSYSSSDHGVYQNSEWSNSLEKLVQGSVIEALQESRLFKAVLPYASTASEDLRLESIIYDLSHHIRGEDSYAVVSIEFSLINSDTGNLIKTTRFSYREDTPTVNAKGYVEATNRAMAKLTKDLVVWLSR